MRRVKLKDVVEGMVTAERVTNYKYSILLEENVEITKKQIELLDKWDVEFIRIREEGDTDELLEEQLIIDREAFAKESEKIFFANQLKSKEALGINTDNVLSILSGNGDEKLYSEKRDIPISKSIKVTSCLNKAALLDYSKMSGKLSLILNTEALKRDFFLPNSFELAIQFTQFILTTPNIMGYYFYCHHEPKPALVEHTMRTTVLAGKLAQLLDYSNEEIGKVVLGCLLHDLGCVELPEHLFKQEDQLSKDDNERELFKSHISKGIDILKTKDVLQEVLLIVASHHELLDGSGYPLGLSDSKIHPYAQIASLANAVDVAFFPLDEEKKAVDVLQLINELSSWSNKYDESSCKILKEYLIDFLKENKINLSDGRNAELVVQGDNEKKELFLKTISGEMISLDSIEQVNLNSFYV